MQGSFQRLGAVTDTTPEELARAGGKYGVLPTKSVWTVKPGGVYKCRGVACGNFAQRQPHEQVWTAQAEISSILSALRLAQLRGWAISSMDVKSAFMTADLPPDQLVIVRPPQLWVDLGFIKPGTLWPVKKAIYGLRESPRVWGESRDAKLRHVQWRTGGPPIG